jgi:ribonucleoside-diphosphate reductase alpha chain
MKAVSCPDAIARIVEKVLNERQNGSAVLMDKAIPSSDFLTSSKSLSFCPECGTKVEHGGGCVTCRSCGYSKCG